MARTAARTTRPVARTRPGGTGRVQTPRTAAGTPVSELLDLLGRRWALRILWELSTGPHGFRSLQDACDHMSSSVLSQRLGELKTAGIVETDGGSWSLTPAGTKLLEALAPLQQWAASWARRTSRRR